MFHVHPRTLLRRFLIPVALLLPGAAAAVCLTLPASASALPQSTTMCSGSLAHDPVGAAGGEPNLLDYSFYCTNEISAYSIIIDRVASDGANVDDFSTNPTVLSAGQPSATESVDCDGAIPSDGIDCFSLVGTSAGPLGPGDEVQGSIDPTSQYCSYLPKGARPGTPAVARAIVELVVTDNSGAQDGPFELTPQNACPRVPAVVPTPKKVTIKARPRTTRPSAASSRRQTR